MLTVSHCKSYRRKSKNSDKHTEDPAQNKYDHIHWELITTTEVKILRQKLNFFISYNSNIFKPWSCSIFLNFLTNQTTSNRKLFSSAYTAKERPKNRKPSNLLENKGKGERIYQAVAVDAPPIGRKLHETTNNLLISLFFPLASHFRTTGEVWGRNPRSFFEKTEAELEELELNVLGSRTEFRYRKWMVSEMRNLEERKGGLDSVDWTLHFYFLFFFGFLGFFFWTELKAILRM